MHTNAYMNVVVNVIKIKSPEEKYRTGAEQTRKFTKYTLDKCHMYTMHRVLQYIKIEQ